MRFIRKSMVEWFDVGQLASTGMKAVISAIFGNFSDKREIQSAFGDQAPFEYCEKEEIWIDYVADLGDGFNSTYTVASLLAAQDLDAIYMEGDKEERLKKTPRGEILIMGGDEVYPTPTREEYINRLQGPYEAAFPEDREIIDEKRSVKPPHLYAIPGNHDWYDGLTSFTKVFCQDRSIGNWLTRQKRSYFAIKLPNNYWIWAIDIMLNSDIDKMQLDYFEKLEYLPGDKIILCTAEPSWVLNTHSNQKNAFEGLDFFIRRYITSKNLNLKAVLSGDLHHYSRYEEIQQQSKTGTKVQFITAGGRGAFTSPTHNLKNEIDWGHEHDVDKHVDGAILQEHTFPSQKESKKLLFNNFWFFFYNPYFCMFLGFIFLMTAWILESSPVVRQESVNGVSEIIIKDSFMKAANIQDSISGVWFTIEEFVFHNPTICILNLMVFLGIFLFTDTKYGRGKWNLLAGLVHATLQVLLFYFLVVGFTKLNLQITNLEVNSLTYATLFSLEMLSLGSFAIGIIFGGYLIISSLFFKNHATESFSAFRCEDYKNFLRMKISNEGLTIYPYGIKKVNNQWTVDNSDPNKPKFTPKKDRLEFRLIEKPIEIKN